MNTPRLLLAALAAAALASCGQQDRASIEGSAAPGEAAYVEKCAMCHRAGGMGAVLLARRMEPALAPLEAREDLAADYVVQVVRSGVGNMPRISRAEVSDEDLSRIAGYLAHHENAP